MNKIRFTPRWQGAIEGRAINLTRHFFPALCADHEFDDVMQEAYIVYMRCKERNEGDNPAWFMAFFSFSLRNRLINMATKSCHILKHTTSLEALLEDDVAGASRHELQLHLSEEGNDGYIRVLLSELPEAVKQLIHDVCFAPPGRGTTAYRKLRESFPSLA